MIRSRIAPTPSGYLHIGNAMNFVMTWLMVRMAGGKLRLRIDDIDAPRAKPEYIEDIFRTLEWIGMDWDEGPQTPDEQKYIYSQALRAARYNGIIKQLIDTGEVYACTCSRKEVIACECKAKGLAFDTPDSAVKIITTEEPILVPDAKMGTQKIYLQNEMKDFVIRRRDGISAYQVASLADDIDHDINLIVRGADLLSSTAAQLYLASLTGNDSFVKTTFYHHPLLMDVHGRKLSKSTGSLSLKAMRERDSTPEKFHIELSRLMGYEKACTSLREMLDADPTRSK
ncbi:MAG: Glutamyl-tRNA synthetase, class Ic [Bacteroidetes bacterium]|nr:Glutamyl-tRNA synthetase, class Ic [Bacteroidota bacterium]